MPIRIRATIPLLLLLTLAAACGDAAREAPGADTVVARTDTAGTAADTARANTATATVRDSAGRELGTLTLRSAGAGITVAGRLTGLPPGEHAMHLHMRGACEPPSFESAGDHWNPTNAQHGAQSEQGQHLGDLPNVTVGSDGSVTVQAATTGGSLGAEPALLDADGAAVVVHAGPDDYRSQPSGDSGAPIACGIVQG